MLLLVAGGLGYAALQPPPVPLAPTLAPLAPPLPVQRSSRSLVDLAPTVTPTPTPTSTPIPTATPTPSPTPIPPLPDTGPVIAGEILTQTLRVDVYIGINSLHPAHVAEVLARVDAGILDAEAKLGSQLAQRVSIGVYQPSRRPAPGVRGIAYTDLRRIELYYASGEPVDGLVRVMIHEVAHQLQYDRYGPAVQRSADVILHEGLATWLSGTEWLARSSAAPSWQARAAELAAAGRLLPIRTDPSGAAANDAYEGWAAFVDYLIAEYGWERFDAAYRSSRGRYPGSAAYTEVYGADLDTLVAAWRATLSPE